MAFDPETASDPVSLFGDGSGSPIASQVTAVELMHNVDMAGPRRHSRQGLLAAGGLCAAMSLGMWSTCTAADASIRSSSTLPPALDTKAFSDQGELAFVSENALFVLDGSSQSIRRVTTGQPVPIDPAFSHDGRWLAFLRPVGHEGADVLWMARGDGADAHRVVGMPDAFEVPDSDGSVMSWSPTQDELLITTGPVKSAPLVPRQVWTVTPTGPSRRLLGPGYVNGVAWSPKGTEVAAIWSAKSLASETLETISVRGGSATNWLRPGQPQAINFLAGWSPQRGIVLWQDQGGGGPSVENYGLPLGVISKPGAPMAVLGTVPIFQPPAVSIGDSTLAVVVNGNPSSGQGEGEKFVWFGKSVELCGSVPSCTPVSAPWSSVTEDPTISPVDGSLAFVEAPQTEMDLPPLYSATASWEQVSSWYATADLWMVPEGSDSPVQVGDTAGAVDPAFSLRGTGLLFVKGQALWLLPGPGGFPVEITGPLQQPPAPYLFGYVDWSDEFAWWA